MSKTEIELVKKILYIKKLKNEYVKLQNYEMSIPTRDEERYLEKQLVKITNRKLDVFFLENLNFKYSSIMNIQDITKILRQIKLIEIGI